MSQHIQFIYLTRTCFIQQLWQVTDENQSHYLADNCKAYGCDEEDADFEESNLMHSMNGRMYANLEGLEMTVGDKVRWYVAAFGTEVCTPACFSL
jgi:hypothetical protein